MNDDKTGVRLNEVLGRRSAEGNTEMKAELNSAPLGRKCRACKGTGYRKERLTFWVIESPCRECNGTGREAPKGAERRPNGELSVTPPKVTTE